MDTAPIDQIIVNGLLRADGTVRLDQQPELPPGPVEISIRALVKRSDRLPDAALDDTGIPAPLDLPRPGVIHPVKTVKVTTRVPDLLTINIDVPCTEK